MASTYWHAFSLILDHAGYAVAMALVFGAGAVFAFPVLRWRVGPLLVLPAWFARRIERMMRHAPSRIGLGAYIFLFNGTAILLYMLTGLVPGAPAIVAFVTGMNVMLAGMMSRPLPVQATSSGSLSLLARICAVVTFCLELPCFWCAMAMGWTIYLPDGERLIRAQDRIVAYGLVILPLLAVSAFAEAHAVLSALNHGDGKSTDSPS